MIHYVYVGYFVHEGSFIRFEKQADGAVRPAVNRPLSPDIVQRYLKRRGLTTATIPDEWGLWLEDGFIVCDRFSRSRDAIEFVKRLATETGCDIADYSSQTLISPTEL